MKKRKIVGYYTYGSLADDVQYTIQSNGKIEGSIWYRKLYLNWLHDNGYDIYLLNEKRDWKKYPRFDVVKDSKTFSARELYNTIDWIKQDGSIKLEDSWREMYSNIYKVNWPNIDLLILDNAGYPFFPIFTYKLMLILAYMNKVPVIVLDDDDSTLSLFERANRTLRINIQDNINVATHYKQKLFPNQLFFPFPYDKKLERDILPVDKLEHDYVYIGHDYDRREKMIKFYFDTFSNFSQMKVEIYGDWTKWLESKKSEKYPKDIFKGSIAQADGFDLLNKTIMTTVIVPPYCEERGHITPRLHEAVMVGCIVLADKDIYTIENYMLKENIISSNIDIHNKFIELSSQTFKQRKEMVEEQRKISRKFTVENIWSKMFEEAKIE
jgi:hypothetical protein